MDRDNIYFINTPVDIQDEYFERFCERLENVPDDAIIYLRYAPCMSLHGKFYFEVYVCESIVEHSSLNYPADFLIFLK